MQKNRREWMFVIQESCNNFLKGNNAFNGFRHILNFLLVKVNRIDNVLRGDKEHQHQERQETYGINGILVLRRDAFSEDQFWQRKENTTAIQRWDRQQIGQSKAIEMTIINCMVIKLLVLTGAPLAAVAADSSSSRA